MRLSLKDNLLTVALSKPERTKLEKAREVCEVLVKLSPIDKNVEEAANKAFDGLETLAKMCVKAESEAPGQLPLPLVDPDDTTPTT